MYVLVLVGVEEAKAVEAAATPAAVTAAVSHWFAFQLLASALQIASL